MRWWDIDDVLGIERVVFAGEPPWTGEQFWAELAGVPERRWYLVAEDDHAVVGYAGLAIAADSADVMTVAVHPGCRRSGVGRALLSELIETARQRRLHEVFLEVRADNVAATSLYESLGFTTMSRRRGYYTRSADALVMRRLAE